MTNLSVKKFNGVFIGSMCEHRRKKRKIKLLLELTIDNLKIRGKIMAVSLTATQLVEGTLQPVDAKGKPAKVQVGTVTFASSDPNVFTVTQDPTNESKVVVTAVGEGTAQLDYSADADLGDGIKNITGFTAVEVLAAEAVGFGISFGTPTEQP